MFWDSLRHSCDISWNCLKILSEIEYFCSAVRCNFRSRPVSGGNYSCMTGDSADAIDPSKNPEVLFSQLKKTPGMHALHFDLLALCPCCIFEYILFVWFCVFLTSDWWVINCSLTCMFNVACEIAVHDHWLCWTVGMVHCRFWWLPITIPFNS